MEKKYEGIPVTDMLALSHVPRWSIVPRYREQSVADHTFRVMVIVDELGRMLRLDRREIAEVVYLSLFHDAHECRTADIPSPFHATVKEAEVTVNLGWTVPSPCHPTSLYAHIIKLADLIEAYTWIVRNGMRGSHVLNTRFKLAQAIFDHVDTRKVFKKEEVTAILNSILDDNGREPSQ